MGEQVVMPVKPRHLLAILVVSISFGSNESVWAMKAGASRRDVTIPELLGNPAVHDPLFARVLVLDNGETAVTIICLDMVSPWFPEVREKLVRDFGMARVLVNCSHTH